MKRKNLLLALLGVVSVSSLAGCGSSDAEVNSLSSALKYMCNNYNYTISYTGTTYVKHSLVYTTNAVGVYSTTYPAMDNIYIKDNGGVYHLTYDDGHVPSEYLPYGTDLFDGTYRYSLFGVSASYINKLNPNVNEVTISDKTYRMGFLLTIGFKSTDIVNMGALTALYADKQVTFSTTLGNTPLIYVASDFGTTKIKIVDDFLKDGGSHFIPNNNQQNFRKLIRSNNFSQEIYQFGDSEETTGYIGTANFHPHYYFQYYNASSNYLTGAIALNCKATDEHPELYGCYQFSLVYSESGGTPSVMNIPSYSEPDVVAYYHYPTFLSLLDNMQYMKKWNDTLFPDVSHETTSYTVTHMATLTDFASNFSLDNAFSGHTPVALGIDYKITADKNHIIYFYYRFNYDGTAYIMPIPLYNFGKVSNNVLDQIYNEYND